MNEPLPGLQDCRCPACRSILTGATAITDAGIIPAPGDLSICIYCGAALAFDGEPDRLHLRLASPEERRALGEFISEAAKKKRRH